MAFKEPTAKENQEGANERVLHDIDLEQALLGTFFRDAATIAAVRPIVGSTDFFDPLHQAVAELIFEFDEDGKAISPLTINSWSKHWPGMVAAGGLNYLQALYDAAPARRNVESWASDITDYSQRRQAHAALTDAGAALYSPAPIQPALEPVVAIADAIAERATAATETEARQIGDTLLRDIEQQAVSGEEFGIKTGLKPLDDVLGALYGSQLIILAGRPGMGKSAAAGAMALAAALQGVDVDWWSIEMPGRECVARLISDIDYDTAVAAGLKPIAYESLVKKRITGGPFERAIHANSRLHDLPISILDRSKVTMAQIAATSRARWAIRGKKPRLVIIDHLHIVQPEDRYRGRRVDELSEMTAAAKRLAKRIDSPVLLLAQLSRDVEKRDDKRPNLSDLRDSGSIEQDADVVMFVYRPEYYAKKAYAAAKTDEQRIKAQSEEERAKNVLEIAVEKQRSGATRTAECWCDIASSVIRGAALDGPQQMTLEDGFAGVDELTKRTGQ